MLFKQDSAQSSDTDDLVAKAEKALATLDEIDAHYERERNSIQLWPIADRSKQRMLGRLQAQRQAEREPVVQTMIELRELLQRKSRGR